MKSSTFFCVPVIILLVKLNYHTKYHILVKAGAAVVELFLVLLSRNTRDAVLFPYMKSLVIPAMWLAPNNAIAVLLYPFQNHWWFLQFDWFPMAWYQYYYIHFEITGDSCNLIVSNSVILYKLLFGMWITDIKYEIIQVH